MDRPNWSHLQKDQGSVREKFPCYLSKKLTISWEPAFETHLEGCAFTTCIWTRILVSLKCAKFYRGLLTHCDEGEWSRRLLIPLEFGLIVMSSYYVFLLTPCDLDVKAVGWQPFKLRNGRAFNSFLLQHRRLFIAFLAGFAKRYSWNSSE